MSTQREIQDWKEQYVEETTRGLRDRIAELAQRERDPEKLAALIVDLPEVTASIKTAASSNAMFAMRGR